MEKGYNAACVFCILREHHAVGIVFITAINALDMIYKGVTRLQASAGDCVAQLYHPPSDLIVTLLTELAELENDPPLDEGPGCFINARAPKWSLFNG